MQSTIQKDPRTTANHMAECYGLTNPARCNVRKGNKTAVRCKASLNVKGPRGRQYLDPPTLIMEYVPHALRSRAYLCSHRDRFTLPCPICVARLGHQILGLGVTHYNPLTSRRMYTADFEGYIGLGYSGINSIRGSIPISNRCVAST
jgi:hypothetical protein